MSVPDNLPPGTYTLKWMLDVRTAPSVAPLRIAQVAAYALQPGFGTLRGNAPQPTDVEYIVNSLSSDTITGVVRIQFPMGVATADVGGAILEAVAQLVPEVQPHVQAANALSALSPITGLLATAAQRIVGESFSARFGSVIIDYKVGVDNSERPAAGANPTARLLNNASQRVSEDPARAGTIGAANARELANSAFNPPTWAIVAMIAAGVVFTGVLGYVVAKKVS